MPISVTASSVRNGGVGLLFVCMVRLLDGTRNQTVPRANCKSISEIAVTLTANAGPVTLGCPFCTKQNSFHKWALFRIPLQKSARVAKPSG
jgi:hypothetical protein